MRPGTGHGWPSCAYRLGAVAKSARKAPATRIGLDTRSLEVVLAALFTSSVAAIGAELEDFNGISVIG